jgi:hypothetical protein
VSLYDRFHREWTLLALHADREAVAAFMRAAAAAGMDLRVFEPPPGVSDLKALYEAPLALIRPDQIVAWRGSDASDAPAVVARVLGHDVPER